MDCLPRRNLETMTSLKLLVLSCVFVALPASANWFGGTSGNGRKTTQTRLVTGFTADSNIIPLVTTEVAGDTLTVDSKESIGNLRGKSELNITVPDLRAVSVKGSSDVTVTGFTEAHDLSVKIEGSGDVKFTGNAAKINVAIHGSGEAELTVNDGMLNVHADGSGDVVWHGTAKVGAFTSNGSGSIHHR